MAPAGLACTGFAHVACPYGAPGDRLWVRETWRITGASPEDALDMFDRGDVQYRADDDQSYIDKYRPSIHMPRRFSRITLEVTGVRVERLQDISEADAMAEGIVEAYGGFALPAGEHFHASDPRQSYFSLFEAINGPGSVEANPWLWCVSFRRVACVSRGRRWIRALVGEKFPTARLPESQSTPQPSNGAARGDRWEIRGRKRVRIGAGRGAEIPTKVDLKPLDRCAQRWHSRGTEASNRRRNMNAYTHDNTVMAAARNAVQRGEEFSPMLCGTSSTWQQRRLFECEMLLTRAASAAHLLGDVPTLILMRDSYLSGNYSAAHADSPSDSVFC